ncbi:MAG: tyrosine-type recombinase/integrase [Clostridia bacterium]|nr:tyrosine-type recombinase/integrase [Clostridia bacterium]
MNKITAAKMREYKLHLINEEKSENTTKKYTHDIKIFADWTEGRSINKPLVLEYKEKLKKEYAASSVNSILSSLNSFFDFCGNSKLKVKTLKIQKQIFAGKERELSTAEYSRLLTASKSEGNERLFLLMQTICGTGIRVSELQYITAESIKAGKARINMKGKLRIVIIPSALCKALSKYAKKRGITSGSIFLSRNGRPLDRCNIWRMMRSICEKADVEKEKVFPHNLRHLFARTYYSLQKDIVRLADILGHTSVNTTRIYTMETGDIHRRQIEHLGLLRC